MFGYVVIDKPNILIKDYETYQSYYCGLCKSIGREYGTFLRLTLNYDIVLFALLGHNYEGIDPQFCQEHCITHWVKKVPSLHDTPVLRRVADMNMILGYFKASDDVADEGRHRLWKSAIGSRFQKAVKKMPDFAKNVQNGYEKLREKEKLQADADRLADAFGEIMLSSAEALTEKADSDLKKLLYYIGRWVYLIDAVDDVKKDLEKGCYNPFLREEKGWDDKVFVRVEKEARPLLYDCIDRIIETYENMKIEISKGALDNVIYRGFKTKTEQVLTAKGEKCKDHRLKF